MNDWLYSDTVKDHFMNPATFSIPTRPTGPCDGRGIVGYQMRRPDAHSPPYQERHHYRLPLENIRMRERACFHVHSFGSGKGMRIDDAYILKPEDIVSKLGGLPSNKIHCSVLGDKALRAAIDDYLEKNKLPPLAGRENVEVICSCLNITDRDIEEAYKAGDRSWEDLQARTKIGTACGSCKERTLEFLHELEHLYGE